MKESLPAANQGNTKVVLLNSMSRNIKIAALVCCVVLTIAITVVLLVSSRRTSPLPPDLEFFPHSTEDEKRIRAMVDEINEWDLPWKAEYNALASLPTREKEEYLADFSALQLEGLSLEESREQHALQDTDSHLFQSLDLPHSFDAREQWPQCPSMRHIQNQGGCGSCWAAAATSSISDRLCISSNFTKRQLISTQDLLSCCDFCGRCQGGYVTIYPFVYWKLFGIVSGGSQGSNEGCRPYEISSTCGAPCPSYFARAKFNPICERKCQPSFDGSYEKDLARAKSVYFVKMGEEYGHMHEELSTTRKAYKKYIETLSVINTTSTELIKREIFLHGPVMMCYGIHEPFMHYRSGVYTMRPASEIPHNEALHYGHCMKILGWGEENGEKYWLIANSWGTKWGDNGFGKISMNYYPQRMTVVAGLW